MRRSRFFWLLTAILGLSILGWFTNSFLPDSPWLITLFFVLIWITIGSLLTTLKLKQFTSFLIASGICLVLFLRLIGLRHPLYLAAIIALGLILELMLRKR